MQQHCGFQLRWLILHAVCVVELPSQELQRCCCSNIDYLVKTVVSFLTHDGSADHPGGGSCVPSISYIHISVVACVSFTNVK